MWGSFAKAWMFGVCGQHCPALDAHVLLSQLNSLSPHPWSSVRRVSTFGLAGGAAELRTPKHANATTNFIGTRVVSQRLVKDLW
eukprot:COSAG01_NODE_5648_length_4118_cov_3.920129_5_plen_84_part_00